MNWSSFFGNEYAIPDALLKSSTPQNHVEGLVLKVGKDGNLSMPEMGRVKGPVVFVRQAKKSVRKLVEISSGPDYDATMDDGYYELKDSGKINGELLHIILDPKASIAARSWATVFLDDEGENTALTLIGSMERITKENISDRDAANLKRMLANRASDFATMEATEKLVEIYRAHSLPATTLIKSIKNSKHAKYYSQLLQWTYSENNETRLAATRALSAFPIPRLGSLEHLTRMRADPEAELRVAALAGILDLSQDPAERTAAIKALAKLVDSEEYINGEIARALAKSRSKEAVGPLVAILESNRPAYERAAAATALGDLGFPEAVPALMAMKSGQPDKATRRKTDEEEFMEALAGAGELARVRKAVVEALWKFDQKGKLK